MQLTARRGEAGASARAWCWSRKKVGRDNPRADRAPTFRNSRRVVPVQSLDLRPVSRLNIESSHTQGGVKVVGRVRVGGGTLTDKVAARGSKVNPKARRLVFLLETRRWAALLLNATA